MLSSVQSEVPTTEVPVILVVEDNPVERALVSRILRNAEFNVVAVDCGSRVLECAIRDEPDIILLDALLPDIDGFQVCQELSRHPKARFIPVVMLTGLDDVTSIDRAYEVGATDFITKPINHSLLVHRIRYLLRARGLMDELRRSRQSLASAQKIAKLGHWEFNIEKKRATFSEELCQLYRLDFAQAINNGYQPLLDVCHPNDRAALERAIIAATQDHASGRVEHRVEYSDGTERVVEMHLAAIPDADGSRHLLGISMDVTVRKETEREMLRLAYFDRLTGLPNRSLLELILDQEIPRAHLNGQSVTLVYIDLDLFSRVNNAMGDSAGDAVLRQVAARLGRLVTAPTPQSLLERLSLTMELSGDWCGGLVARLGADTFAVLMTTGNAAETQVREMATAARQLFQQPFLYRGQERLKKGTVYVIPVEDFLRTSCPIILCSGC